MSTRMISGGLLAAAAGAAMLAMSAAPAAAFTLSGPSLAPVVASTQIENVWWDRWGRWHPNHRWNRHCWRGYWGRLHCRWGW